ncbi:hypothetical protein D3C87_1706060 [compost metagenome]
MALPAGLGVARDAQVVVDVGDAVGMLVPDAAGGDPASVGVFVDAHAVRFTKRVGERSVVIRDHYDICMTIRVSIHN